VALYPYSALNEDELSFEKDDVIILLAREEASWWRGELKGVSGLFPSNYVAPLCEYICILDILIQLFLKGNLQLNLYVLVINPSIAILSNLEQV
jgi:hypothetical protein